MANTYTWSVSQCDRVLASGLVTTVHYNVVAETEDGVYRTNAYGSVGLEAPDEEDMIAYDSLTEAQCVSWVQQTIGGADKVAEIHAALDAQLTEKRTPTIGKGTPW